MKGRRIAKKSFLLSINILLIALCLGAQGNSKTEEKIDPLTAQVSAAPMWEAALDDLVNGTPFLQAYSAVLACAGGSVKSFFMSGTPLWNFNPREKVTPSIARSLEGSTYVCNTAGTFMAVNRVGRELWRVDLGGQIRYPPIVGWDGRVFIFLDSKISCRTASGLSLWDKDLGSPIAAGPILDHAGGVAVVLQNQEFVRINQFSAIERLKLDRSPSLIVPLLNEKQNSYVLLYSSGEAEKITLNDGARRGSRLSRSRFASLPATPAAAIGRGNQLAVTLRDGRITCMDGSGKALWSGNTHESAAEKGPASLGLGQALMHFDERGIYTISTRGATGFAANGRRRFILKLGQEASGVPGFSDEGLLYVCGKDTRLRTFKIDGKPRTVPRSRYYGPEPEGSYGMGNPPPSPWASDANRFDHTMQEMMYNRIEKAINSGQIGEDEPRYVAYLMEMIGFFLNDPHYSKARPAVMPHQHVKFINLLGRVGSRETVPFLWNIFDRYTEPSVRSACAEAIGTIGIDPKGGSFTSYNFLLSPNNPNTDPQLLISATSSIAAICRFVGPPLAADGIQVLRYFMNLPSTPNAVKTQIRNEVDALRREGLDIVIR